MKSNKSTRETPQKRLTDYLSKVKMNKPVIAHSAPPGRNNKSDKGLRND